MFNNGNPVRFRMDPGDNLWIVINAPGFLQRTVYFQGYEPTPLASTVNAMPDINANILIYPNSCTNCGNGGGP
jgi:hypothetical protein